MKKYHIYNHSSENMPELKEASIDFLFTDPPWNIGVKFGKRIDYHVDNRYKKLICKVIKEIKRVIKPTGICLVEVPEKVSFKGKSQELKKKYIMWFKSHGFFYIGSEKLIYKCDTGFKGKITPLAKWKKEKPKNAFSEEVFLLIFSKNKLIKKKKLKKEKSYTSLAKEGHPCPSNKKLIKNILNVYFKKNMNVLDPFMGTANIGIEVLKKGGVFWGYEIVKDYFYIAKRKFMRLDKN